MSVICQNFVQNAWKKDLCSNCFKSLDDHSSIVGGCGTAARTTWKSLITERDRNGNCTKPFRLENGFHGKLLTIVPALNGTDVTPDKQPEVLAVNGHNGRVLGILRTPGGDRTPTKTAVGFKEEEPLVIGYGGNDYDPDEPEFELSNHDDGDFILDSLDETDEDRAISKITRENTEFNAKNANLLPAIEDERNSRNKRKVEPPPKASVKPFFRQTTWSEQSVAVNAARDKQATPVVEEAPKETAAIKEKGEAVMPSKPQAEEEERQNSTETSVENTKSYAARASFLHGASEASEEFTTPTALYTPGDDLFVSRGSTVSSSSDETAVSEYNSEESESPPFDVMEPEAEKETMPPSEETGSVQQEPVLREEPKYQETTQPSLDDSVLYDDGTTIYYAVSPACVGIDKQPKRTPVPIINHYAECGIYQDVSPNRTPSPPESSRSSRLAALAVELEQARYAGGTPVKRQAPSPPDASGYSTPQNSLPISACSTPSVRSTPASTQEFTTPASTKSKSSSLGSGSSRSKILMCIGGGTDDTYNKSRKKFSLKKLLKRGSRDVDDIHLPETGTPNPKAWKQNDFSKIKLEIIHPMDMVANDAKSIDDNTSESNQVSPGTPVVPESMYDNLNFAPQAENNEPAVLPSRSNLTRAIQRPPRPPKPPPPPRSQSMIPEIKGQRQSESPKPIPTIKLEDSNDTKNESTADSRSKPQVPKRQYKLNGKSEYANLGDVRTSVAPKKPERINQLTAEGERMESIKICDVYEPAEEPTYNDTIVHTGTKTTNEESPYAKKEEATKLSISHRVHYSTPPVPPPPPPPYGRIGCSAVSEDKPWTNLETSYSLLSAVNLDVLARILDNAVHDRFQLERPDKETLQWSDFDLETEQPLQILSDKVIYDAIFRNTSRTPVTLLVNPWGLHSSLSGSRNHVRYPILAHFTDHVPRNFAFPEAGVNNNAEGILTSIYVLHRAKLSPLRSLVDEQDYEKEVCFAMLQLIHSLKVLQASGIEDIEPGGHNVFFARTDRDRLHSLVFLSPDLPFEQAGDLFSSMTNSSRVTLCRYALSTMLLFLGIDHINEIKSTKETFRKAVSVIQDVLLKEKSHSLSQAKSVLDYVLWNAEDAIAVSDRMSLKADNVVQRWLDVERARKLKTLAATSLATNLTAVEEHHLTFLVRSSARTLKEVAAML